MTEAVWPWRETVAAGGDEDIAARAARRGAALRAAVGLAVAALVYLWKPWLAVVVVVVTLTVLAVALASPLGLYARLLAGLDRFAHGVGMAVTWVLMPLLYLVLFLPVGLLLRATGKLRLTRGPEAGEASYWRSPRVEGRDDAGRWQGSGVERYRRQF